MGWDYSTMVVMRGMLKAFLIGPWNRLQRRTSSIPITQVAKNRLSIDWPQTEDWVTKLPQSPLVLSDILFSLCLHKAQVICWWVKIQLFYCMAYISKFPKWPIWWIFIDCYWCKLFNWFRVLTKACNFIIFVLLLELGHEPINYIMLVGHQSALYWS